MAAGRGIAPSLNADESPVRLQLERYTGDLRGDSSMENHALSAGYRTPVAVARSTPLGT
jgi:hypothetical protein